MCLVRVPGHPLRDQPAAGRRGPPGAVHLWARGRPPQGHRREPRLRRGRLGPAPPGVPASVCRRVSCGSYAAQNVP